MKKRGLLIIAGCFLSLCLLTGCGKKEDNREAVVTQTLEEIYTQMERAMKGIL